jgi:hypothetical protein
MISINRRTKSMIDLKGLAFCSISTNKKKNKIAHVDMYDLLNANLN